VLLESVRWLRRELSDELVPVLGSAEHFLTNVAEKRTDLPFALASFRKLLSGTLRSHGTPTDTYTMYKWRVVPAPVDAAQRFPLASLPATDQMDVDVMLDAELQDVLLAAGNPPTAASAAAAAAAASATSAASASVATVATAAAAAAAAAGLAEKAGRAPRCDACAPRCHRVVSVQSRQRAVGGSCGMALPRGVCKCSAWFCRRQCSCLSEVRSKGVVGGCSRAREQKQT
jgi:hypothetical protein